MVTLRPASAQPLASFLLLLVVASTGMSLSAASLDRFPGDLPVAEWVQAISVPMFDEAMRGVSAVGWWVPGSIITLCLGTALFILGRKSDAGLFVALVAMATGANWAIKHIIASSRPDPALLEIREELTTYGFPSGHTMFAIVCFGGLAIVLSGVGRRHAILVRLAQILLVLLIAAMAMSRVYLGAHWPSDTVGALFMGGVWLVLLVGARRWLQGKTRRMLESPSPP